MPGLTIPSIRQEAYRLLNETNSSVLGQLPDGTGGTDTISSSAGVTTFITEAITDLCKSCVYIPATATLAFANNSLSASITDATDVSPSGTIWTVTDVYFGSTRLTHASEQSIRANDLDYKKTIAGSSANILYWYKPDAYRISVYPSNSTGGSFSTTIYGAGIPATPSDDTTTLTFLPDDVLKQLLSTYVAMKLIMKNIDDPSLAQRMFWRNWYDEQRMKLWTQMDMSMKTPGAPYFAPPIAQQVQK